MTRLSQACTFVHKEVYVIYGDYFVIASIQKLLIEKVLDEDVTGLTIHVRDFYDGGPRRSTWFAWTGSRLTPLF